MNQNTFIVILVLLLSFSCQTKNEKINDCLAPFVSKGYSDAQFELNVNDNTYTLIVHTNQIDTSIVDKLLGQSLTKLYSCFYNSANSAATNSSFEVIINTSDKKWESETFTLSEMAKRVH